MGKGLIYCGGAWNNSFCITKLTQAVISGLLIIATIVQITLNIYSRGGIKFSFTQIIQILMLLTLICNLTFCINHDLSWFYYLESFFYDCYFSTLVFYVTYRIAQKSSNINKTKLNAIKILYGVFIFIFLAIFVYSGLIDIMDCKQVWFVAIDIFSLLICSIMVQFGYKHHKNQIQQIQEFKNQKQVNNPLKKMWILILINLFCQIIQLTESLVFYFQLQPQKCQFSDKQTVDVVVKFLFSFFSLHLSFLCTIIIFHLRQKNQQLSSQVPIRKSTIATNFIQMTSIQSEQKQNPYFI